MITRCATYLRISQDPNADGLAVSRQREACLSIAVQRGWTVVEEFSDTVSASKANVARPEYARMFEAFKAGQYDALVVYDLDRLTRQPRQLEDWIDLAESRALLITTASGEADLTTDNGRLFARIKASVARAEIERKSARQRAKNRQNVAAGKPVPGKRRFGYKSDGVTPEPTEVPVIVDIYRGIQARESVRSLSVKYGRTATWIKDVVRNKAYCGYVKHQGVFSPEPGAITPIVTLADWEAANLILADPTRKTTPGPKPRHLMSGLAECGLCGGIVHFTTRSYHCRGRADHVAIAKRHLDNAVSEAVFLWAMGEAGSTPAGSASLTSLLADLAEVERQREAQEELYSLPGANRPRIAKRLVTLGAEADRLTQAVNVERAGEAVSGVLAAVRGDWADGDAEFPGEAEEAAEAWPAYWSGLGLEVQRDLVRALLSVTINKGYGAKRVSITYR